MIQLCDRFVIPKIRFVKVPRGNRGTLVTARMIGEMIQSGAKDFYVRQKAVEIFRNAGVRTKDRFGEICALYNWVKQNIRYTRDILSVEIIHSATQMLELPADDLVATAILL